MSQLKLCGFSLAQMYTIWHCNAQCCLLIIIQYQPISLHYYWLSNEQQIWICPSSIAWDRLLQTACPRLRVAYKHHWEFPINKNITPVPHHTPRNHPTLSNYYLSCMSVYWKHGIKYVTTKRNTWYMNTLPICNCTMGRDGWNYFGRIKISKFKFPLHHDRLNWL